MAKRWQKVEINYLKKHAGDKSVEELAERFRTDVATVTAKLRELRLDAGAAAAEDEVVERYRQGLERLYGQQWDEAEELLQRVASEADGDMAARARLFAETARRRRETGAEGDPYVRAVVEKNRGRYDEALALCQAKRRAEKDGRFAYLAAALHTLEGDLDRAAEALSRAIELDPRNRVHGLHDPDLGPLRASPEHGGIFRG
ncbi:MAG TPA: hypothetical protein VMT16_12290 [Thermoanaerobaculia bacterium]|nr:hypothetical protein [Thermoanaerobaculia bacterium]